MTVSKALLILIVVACAIPFIGPLVALAFNLIIGVAALAMLVGAAVLLYYYGIMPNIDATGDNTKYFFTGLFTKLRAILIDPLVEAGKEHEAKAAKEAADGEQE